MIRKIPIKMPNLLPSISTRHCISEQIYYLDLISKITPELVKQFFTRNM